MLENRSSLHTGRAGDRRSRGTALRSGTGGPDLTGNSLLLPETLQYRLGIFGHRYHDQAIPGSPSPIVFVYQLKHYRWQQLIIPIVIFLLVILDMARPFIFIDIGGFIEAFTIQGGRDLQVESVYASFLLLGQMLGIGTAQVYQGRYSVDVEAPLSQPLAQYSFAVTAVCLLITYALFWRRQKTHLGIMFHSWLTLHCW